MCIEDFKKPLKKSKYKGDITSISLDNYYLMVIFLVNEALKNAFFLLFFYHAEKSSNGLDMPKTAL